MVSRKNRQLKFFATGALSGILVGILLSFFYPGLLNAGLDFNRLFNESLGYPSAYYSATGGLVARSLTFLPTVVGLLGGLIGIVIFKLISRKTA